MMLPTPEVVSGNAQPLWRVLENREECPADRGRRPVIFTHGSYDEFEGDPRPAWVRFSMRHWRWSAVPGCILLLALISPADNGAEMQQQIAAARRELSSTK